MQNARIFGEGKNAQGKKIGQYDTKTPLYISSKDAPKSVGTPTGKTGKSKFKNGNTHKTRYFESYKAFREQQGRRTDTVDLRLRGLLQSSHNTGVTPVGKGVVQVIIKRQIDILKVQNAIKKYGEIVFKLSKVEKTQFINSLNSIFFG